MFYLIKIYIIFKCKINLNTVSTFDGHTISYTRVVQKVLSLIGFLRFIPGIF